MGLGLGLGLWGRGRGRVRVPGQDLTGAQVRGARALDRRPPESARHLHGLLARRTPAAVEPLEHLVRVRVRVRGRGRARARGRGWARARARGRGWARARVRSSTSMKSTVLPPSW